MFIEMAGPLTTELDKHNSIDCNAARQLSSGNFGGINTPTR